MRIKETIALIKDDLKRYNKEVNRLSIILFLPGFRYLMFWRIHKCIKSYRWLRPFEFLLKLKLVLMQYHYGIKVSDNVEIRGGCKITHFGGIFINGRARIGKNVEIYQDVTLMIKYSRDGGEAGAPQIGNNVIIGAGAKIIGGVTIGNGAVIGANAVVTKDIPENAVAVGNPFKIVSYKGSEGIMFNLS